LHDAGWGEVAARSVRRADERHPASSAVRWRDHGALLPWQHERALAPRAHHQFAGGAVDVREALQERLPGDGECAGACHAALAYATAHGLLAAVLGLFEAAAGGAAAAGDSGGWLDAASGAGWGAVSNWERSSGK